MNTSSICPQLKLALTGFILLAGAALHAQSSDTPKIPATEAKPESRTAAEDRLGCRFPYETQCQVKTYYLRNVAQQNDANEILVALRNMLNPAVRVFLDSSENTIVLYAPAEQQQLASNLIHELDRPKQSYKLTYTVTETDAGKRVGTQHFSMFIVTGQRSTLKEGSKLPLSTGSTAATPTSAAVQNFQYIDIGMNFDATIDAYAGGLRLRTKVEQSSTTQDKVIMDVAEPVIRQTVIEQVALLTPGKPANLGTIEVPGTTRRIDIDVQADPIP